MLAHTMNKPAQDSFLTCAWSLLAEVGSSWAWACRPRLHGSHTRGGTSAAADGGQHTQVVARQVPRVFAGPHKLSKRLVRHHQLQAAVQEKWRR